eukprot:TRINITY_DN11702_c0_g1_i3.p2 TRINITY_DN11702_c0_g1~~TRINITY_DN11702_c0_g1_i3.p2  ORF type:complete len:105 (-),score=14.41 TRINITY_DN11702_c0_g1_i3:45-359(-)
MNLALLFAALQQANSRWKTTMTSFFPGGLHRPKSPIFCRKRISAARSPSTSSSSTVNMLRFVASLSEPKNRYIVERHDGRVLTKNPMNKSDNVDIGTGVRQSQQ